MCSTSLMVPVRLWAGMASARLRSSGSAAASAGDPIIFRKVRRSFGFMERPFRELRLQESGRGRLSRRCLGGVSRVRRLSNMDTKPQIVSSQEFLSCSTTSIFAWLITPAASSSIRRRWLHWGTRSRWKSIPAQGSARAISPRSGSRLGCRRRLGRWRRRFRLRAAAVPICTSPSRARLRDGVDAFHRAALTAGGRDNGGPGLRPEYHANYYGAFILDPDGYNIEAVCHKPE